MKDGRDGIPAGFGKQHFPRGASSAETYDSSKASLQQIGSGDSFSGVHLEEILIRRKHPLDPFQEECLGQVMQSAWPVTGLGFRWRRS
jgi:hypothetical protein